MKKRFISIMITAVFIMTAVFTGTAYADVTPAPQTAAQCAVLIDANTGEVLMDKDMNMTEFPASTTKMMTALLAIEHLDLDQVVTVGEDVVNIDGSGLDIKPGEQFTVEQLLYGMMLKSANDMAVVLADAVSGNSANFAILMNQKAARIGCTGTNFVTPNGLPDDQHVSTPHDLALIAAEGMKNPTFAKIVKNKHYTIPATNMSPERKVTNSNQLLTNKKTLMVDGVERPYHYDGIKGVKTGFTNAAQACLAADAERNGLDLISVTMHDSREEQYPDAIKILDWGFANYKALTVINKNKVLAEADVENGASKTVNLVPEKDIKMAAEKNVTSRKDLSYKTKAKPLTAPVKKGTEAGTITIYKDGSKLVSYKLVTQKDVDGSFSYKVSKFFKDLFN